MVETPSAPSSARRSAGSHSSGGALPRSTSAGWGWKVSTTGSASNRAAARTSAGGVRRAGRAGSVRRAGPDEPLLGAQHAIAGAGDGHQPAVLVDHPHEP